jgi:hypothetical protein
MGNHPFNVIVVLFWLATMTWLVVAKVLPPLRVGEPPSYQSILELSADQAPVCFSIRLDSKPIGWAANRLVKRPDGVSEFYSRVVLSDLPLEELAPNWLSTVLEPVLRDLGPIDVDKKSKMVIDPLGRLVGFESRLRVADYPDAIKVLGEIEGSRVKLSVQSGDIPRKLESYLPPNAMMSDELAPQTLLPGLRVGQTWTVPMYSPFRPLTSPIEILQARVERAERIKWFGQRADAKLIVYRDDPGAGLADGATRGRAWVRDDGVVLRQEVAVLNSRLHFLRLPDDKAETVGKALGIDLAGSLPDKLSRELLDASDSGAP